MTLPAILFGLLIALLCGALYHLIRDGGFWRLLFYLFLSMLGFVGGHLLGLWRGWVWIPLGQVNLGLSTLGSVVLLLLGDWLSHVEARPESKV